jgi:hypothetical protein
MTPLPFDRIDAKNRPRVMRRWADAAIYLVAVLVTL